MNHGELDELLLNACSMGKKFELALVSQPDRFEIYSTEGSHAAAFRVVLFELVVRAGGRENLRALPTLEADGVAAARHLLRRAAGVEGLSIFGMLGELNRAVTRSRAVGTFGRELSALFASAIEVGRRAYTETALGDTTKSDAERELCVLEAERIVEEELISWQAEHGVVKSAPPPELGVGYYASPEHRSAIHVKDPAGLRSTRFA